MIGLTARRSLGIMLAIVLTMSLATLGTLNVAKAAYAASSDATLSSLTISPGSLSPPFASGTTTYTATVANSATTIAVTPTVQDSSAGVVVDGQAVTSGSSSSNITMLVGINVITVVVTAGDGVTKQTYKVFVTRVPPMVACGHDFTVGLKADGTVIAVGSNGYGECNVADWTGIIQVACGADFTVGLTADGRVLTTSTARSGDVSSLTGIIQVAAGENNFGGFTVGLQSDGHIVVVGADTYDYVGSKYSNINTNNWPFNQVAARTGNVGGLKSDGTFVSVGGQNVSGSGVTQVSVGNGFTVALDFGGTAVGYGISGHVAQLANISGWSHDIVQVAAGWEFAAGLESNGQVVAAGSEENGRVSGISSLPHDIIQVAVGADHTVGLEPDGHVVAAGYNHDGQCNVNYWYLGTNTSSGQSWYLDSLLKMETGSGQSGSVVVPTQAPYSPPDNFTIWAADQPAEGAVVFPTGVWTVKLKLDTDWSNSCSVQIGDWDGATFTAFNPTPAAGATGCYSNGFVTFYIYAGGTVQDTHLFGLEVYNADSTSHEVITDHSSYVSFPTAAPQYLVSIANVSPTSGPTSGGTVVTITGTNLSGATVVMFGSRAASSFYVVSATSVNATSPAGTGTVDITVTTPSGTSANSSADRFTYVAAPTVTNVNPASGPTSGGTVVTITGTNLSGVTSVNFGTAPAASVTPISATSVNATSPAGTGTVDITVTTPSGTSANSSADRFTYLQVGPVALQLSASVSLPSVPVVSSNQSIPLQDIPLQDIPLQDIPLQDIPLQDISLGSTPLQDIPLQDIPLQNSSWAKVLSGTSLQGTPLQDITLKDLFARGIPLQDITLADILLATLPLQDIQVNGTTLENLVLAGTPLQDIPLQDIPLQDIPILGTPLQDIPLRDIAGVDWSSKLAGTALQGKSLSILTLKDLVLNKVPLQDISLRQALFALIPLQNVPWESIPLQDIPLSELFTVTYSANVTNPGSIVAQNVSITETLPQGFKYLLGSTSGATQLDPSIAGQQLTWGPFSIAGGQTLPISCNVTASAFLGSYSCNITATSSNLGAVSVNGTAPVQVTDTFEPNNSIGNAVEISPDRLYFSYINPPTDRDFFKVRVPQQGSLVQVYLSHLPADYDLTLLAGVKPSTVPLQDIPLQDIPLQDIPLQDIPLQDIPLQDIPLQDIPLQDIPLQDIPLQDIPLQDISAHRGTTDEVVSSRVLNQTGDYYIMVDGYNGAYSNQPYMLRVEITPPLATQPLIRSLPPAGPPGTVYEARSPAATQTIIVDNEQRMARYYGTANVTALRSKLQTFAARPDVAGMILPVETSAKVSAAYAAWDVNAADPNAANAVAEAIRGMLRDTMSTRPNAKYVVLVGNDDIIPFYRVPDATSVSNESTYAASAHLQTPSALESSLSHGNILTDDYFVCMAPIPWRGNELYVPDYPIGRLVETPAEMIGMLDTYSANNGQLKVNTALVTGYSFLTSEAQAIVQSLEAQGISSSNITQLISENWNDINLEQALGVSGNSTSPDLASINAHFNHWAAAPANNSSGYFYSTQVLSGQLQGKLVYSLGCHSGLSVSDNVSLPNAATPPGDWTLDMPEAFAMQGAWYIGNTGYGYADSDAIALSAELMLRFTNALSLPSSTHVPVGQALVAAKQGYFLNMGTYGPYDEKALLESTLYGLPMYQIDPLPPSAPATTKDPNLTITINQVNARGSSFGTLTQAAAVTANTTADGTYYSANGATSVVPYRPIQPKVSTRIDVAGNVAHGVLLTGATYQDIPNFAPVIARPLWDTSLYEPQFINEAWYPAKLQTIMSLRTPGGLQQTLVVTPGQFVTTSAGSLVKGTERLYTYLSYNVFYSTSPDFTPPIISQAVLDSSGSLSVTASDGGTVQQVIVLYTNASGGTTWTQLALTRGQTGTWVGKLPNGTVDFLIQAVDDAGNVGMSAFKGLYSPVNTPPVAVNYSYNAVNRTLNVPRSSGVLSGTSDADQNSLTAVLVSAPTHGSLTLNPDGSFSYTAASGFTGKDSFSYQATDGKLNSNTATVSIDVYVDLPPTNILLSNNSISGGQPIGTVVGSFTGVDPDGDTLGFGLVSGVVANDNAEFIIDGNSLKTNAVFDYATKNSYSIRVRAVDPGYLWFEKQFTIYVTPEPVTEAAIGGTAQIGSTLTASVTAPAGATASYRWQESANSGGPYAPISGATSGNYTLVPTDFNQYIEVVATGTGSYAGTVTSAPAGPVQAKKTGKASLTFMVSFPNPSDFNQPVAFVALVLPGPVGNAPTVTFKNGQPSLNGTQLTSISWRTPTGMVIFKDRGRQIGTEKLNALGIASLTSSALAVGSHSVTAEYSGDTTYSGSVSSPVTQTVEYSATIALNSSQNPSTFGQSVTFSANVSSAGGTITGGSVTFWDGAVVLKTVSLNGSNIANMTTSNLSVGKHNISASYDGYGNYEGGTASLTQTVQKANTKTALTSSPNPATFGHRVTFTALVSAGAPGAGVPTGQVVFKDGNLTLGSAILNASGQATLAISTLSKGTHVITVTYGGDSNFLGSTSLTLSQKVQ